MKYYSHDLVQKVNDALERGIIAKPGKKDTVSAIAAYLYSFTRYGGRCIKELDGKGKYTYTLNGKPSTPKEKIEAKDTTEPAGQLSRFDEFLIEIFRENHKIIFSSESLCQKMRLSNEYISIAKEISGSLAESVNISLKKLSYLRLIAQNEEGDYYCK